MRQLLLCPPDHYGIEYEINPWMDRSHNALPVLARNQWGALKDVLHSLDCQIELIPPEPKLPSMLPFAFSRATAKLLVKFCGL